MGEVRALGVSTEPIGKVKEGRVHEHSNPGPTVDDEVLDGVSRSPNKGHV